MSVALSYNGFSGFSHVRITRYEHVPDISPERASRGSTRHVLEGEAILQGSGNTSSSLSTKIADLAARLNQNGKSLSCSWTGTGGSEDQTLVDVAGDDRTGPYPNVRISEVIGLNTAIVAFSFEWFKTEQVGSNVPSIVREFVMVAKFTVDAVGLTTMTRTGYITLTKSSASPAALPIYPTRPATGTAATPPAYGYAASADRADIVPDYPKPPSGTPTNAFPDEYRRLIAGNLLPGFRREGQEWAIDETRTRMMFTVIDREYGRGIPAPARMADVSFSFEREAGSERSALGIKSFVATLEGPPNVAPADLVALAVRLSQGRIYYNRVTIGGTTYEPDIIQRIAVTEQDMMSANRIRFEVEAKATCLMGSTGGGTVLQATPWKSAGLLGNILADLNLSPSGGTAITFTFTATSYPDAYGTFGVYRVTPNHYDPDLQEASKTWNSTRTLAAADKADVVYEFPQAFFEAVVHTASDALRVHSGKDNAKSRKDSASAGGTANPYVSVRSSEVRKIDTAMVLLSAQDLEAADIPFQVRKPKYFVHQRMEATRMNARPEPQFGPIPSGAIVVYETPAESGGFADLNNNRMITAVFERVLQVADSGGANNTGTPTVTQQFFTKVSGSNTMRQAWAHGYDGTVAAKLPSLPTRDIVVATGDPTTVGDEKFDNATRTPMAYVLG